MKGKIFIIITLLSLITIAPIVTSCRKEETVVIDSGVTPIENYNITYDLNGGVNNVSNPTKYNKYTNLVLLPPTKEGFKFDGWYIDSNFQKEIEIIDSTFSGDIKLYAKFIKGYKISYILNGGINSKNNPNTFEIEEDEFILEEPTKNGFVFGGWFLDNEFNNPITSLDDSINSDITLYAKFNQFSYEYELVGNKYYISKYNGSEKEISLPNEYQGIEISGIKSNAFENNVHIEKIIFNSSLNVIEANAFKNCEKLKELDFSASSNLSFIGEYAFFKSTPSNEIDYIYLPESVTTIEDNAFNTESKRIVFSNNVNTTSKNTYFYNYKYSDIYEENNVKYVFDGSEYYVLSCNALKPVIPATINELPVTKVLSLAFANTDFDLVTFESDEITFEEEAFYNSSTKNIICNNSKLNLSKNSLPTNSKKIFINANTINAQANSFDNSNIYVIATKEISNKPMYCKIHLLTDDDNVVNINNQYYLEKDNSLRLISGNDIENIDASTTEIAEYAFCDLAGIVSLDITNTQIESIKDNAFMNIEKINIIVPKSIRYVSKNAFNNATLNLAQDNNIYFGTLDNPYYFLYELNTSIIVDGTKIINDNALTKNVNELIIPNSICHIGDYAFSKYSGELSLSLPNVEYIGNDAFINTSFDSIVINDKLEYLGSNSIVINENTSLFINSLSQNIELNTSIIFNNTGKYLYYSSDDIFNLKYLHFENVNLSSIDKIPNEFFKFNNEIINLYSSSLTEIGEYAFYGSNIKNIIAKKLKTIGNHSFEESYIDIECILNVEEIGDYALYNLKSNSVSNIEFNNLIRIGNFAISNNNINNLILPNSLEEVGKGNLIGNEVNSLTLPFIGKSASEPKMISYFLDSESYNKNSEFTKLKNITITSSNKLADFALANISGLDVLEFKEDVNFGAYSLTNTNVKTLKISRIQNWVSIDFSDGSLKADGIDCETIDIKVLEIPEGVERIGNYAFADNKYIEELVLPTSLKEIGVSAFEGCSNLKKINFSSDLCGVKKIASRAFYNNTSLSEIEFNQNMIEIGDYAFSLSSITKLDMSKSNITDIKDYAFSDCSNLTDILFSNKLENLGKNSLAGLVGLTKISLPQSLKKIEEDCFLGTVNITEVKLNQSLDKYNDIKFENIYSVPTTYGCKLFDQNDNEIKELVLNSNTINKYKFYNASSIERIILTEDVKEIDSYAFAKLKNLVRIEMKDELTSFKEGAFYLCDNIKSVITNSIDGWFNKKFENYYANPLFYADKLYSDSDLINYAKKIIVPNNVTVINDNLFVNYSSLETIELHENIEKIGGAAFYSCQSLKEIVGLDSINFNVGPYAFANCKGLNGTINFSNFDNIGANAFFNCINIENINISNVLKVSEAAFNSCNCIKSIIISNVGLIDNRAFSNCYSLENIDLTDIDNFGFAIFENSKNIVSISTPKYIDKNQQNNEKYEFLFGDGSKKISELQPNLTSFVLKSGEIISPELFIGCTKLNTIELPNTITSIGNDAFSGCNLLEIDLSSLNLSKIENGVFRNNKNLKNILLPNSLEEIGSEAFMNCSSLPSFIFSEKISSIQEKAFLGCSLLSTIDLSNTKLTEIANSTFSNNTSLTNVLLPNTVLTIGEGAFKDDTKLVTINVDNIENINKEVFYNCSTLKTLNFGTSLKTIGAYALAKCSKLASVGDVSSVINIDNNAFQETAISSFTIPSGVYELPKSLFYDCRSLTTVKLHENVVSIGAYAFACNSGCTNMSSFEFLGNVNLGDYAFKNRTGLLEINGSDYINNVSNNLFENCSKLKSLTLKNEITTIGDYAFSGCSNLQIIIPNNVETIGIGSYRYVTLLDTSFPASLNTIGESAFYGANLTKLESFGEGLVTIGNNAFQNAKLPQTINFLNSLRKIGNHAFKNASYVKNIVLNDDLSSIGNYTFEGLKLDSFVFNDNLIEVGIRSFYDVEFGNQNVFDNGIYVPSKTNDKFMFLKVDGSYKGTDFTISNDTKYIYNACLNNTNITKLSTPFVGYMRNKQSRLSYFYYSADYYDSSNSYVSSILESITITENIDLGNNIFNECSNIKEIDISICNSANASSIGKCVNLKKIYLSISGVEYGILENCQKLEFLSVGGQYPNIGLYFNKDATKNSVPATLVEIEYLGDIIYETTFEKLSNVTTITVSTNLTEIMSSSVLDKTKATLVEYEGGLYLSTKDNQYYALVKILKDDYIRHSDVVVICNDLK